MTLVQVNLCHERHGLFLFFLHSEFADEFRRDTWQLTLVIMVWIHSSQVWATFQARIMSGGLK